jgi:TolB-like protein/Flp pilus assembly protein TadD
MDKGNSRPQARAQEPSAGDRLDSWKEIASYLKREPRTVQRWEKKEGLPIHRHLHDKQGTVYAYKSEIDVWWAQRRVRLEAEPEPPEAEEPPQPAEAMRPVPGPSRRDKAILAVVAIALVLGSAAWLLRQWLESQSVPSGKIMLAVLPFDNLSGDPEQNYFSDGLTEEMITRLGRLHPERLGVIARTTVMNPELRELNVNAVGRRLGVQYVLEGSFRRAGDNIRITAQLIEVKDQTHLWAETYDVERPLAEVLDIQKEVAAKVANSLALELLPAQQARLSQPRPVEPRAYEAYLRGRFLWNQRTEGSLQSSMAYLQEAVTRDPHYALAHSGMADQYVSLGFYSVLPPREAYRQAKEAAQRALESDEMLAEAHAALGTVLSDYEWDWAGAEKEFRRAIELNPSYAAAHQWFSAHLVFMGRFEEAWQHIQNARRLDPGGLVINSDIALNYYYARNYEKAIEHCQELLHHAPQFPLAHLWMGAALAQKGQFAEAIGEFEAARGTQGNLFPTALLGYAYGRAGRSGDARRILRELDQLSKTRFVSAAYYAVVYIGLEDTEQALAWMEKSFAERSPLLARLKVEPIVDPLRSHPQFQSLLRRVGLP